MAGAGVRERIGEELKKIYHLSFDISHLSLLKLWFGVELNYSRLTSITALLFHNREAGYSASNDK